MIAIVVPSLNRPQLLAPLAQNVEETTSHYQLVFVLDEADSESRQAVEQIKNAKMLIHGGTYPQKTNAGVRATDAPLVLLTNDDVVFHPRWFTEANLAFADGVQVVGPDDLSPASDEPYSATMPIVRRSYIEDPGAAWGEPGKALHEGYHHNYAETELWSLALDRGVAKRVPECVIEHCHPDWGKAEVDETYQRGAYSHFERDQALFTRRSAAWQ